MKSMKSCKVGGGSLMCSARKSAKMHIHMEISAELTSPIKLYLTIPRTQHRGFHIQVIMYSVLNELLLWTKHEIADFFYICLLDLLTWFSNFNLIFCITNWPKVRTYKNCTIFWMHKAFKVLCHQLLRCYVIISFHQLFNILSYYYGHS